MIRLGLVRQAAVDKFGVLGLTDEGLAVLKQRKPVRLTRPVGVPEPQARRVGEIACDELLFERLVRLRKRLADERGVPPHILFSDVSLRQMARDYPGNEGELARNQRHEREEAPEFGRVVLAVIAGHLETQPRQIFAATSFEEPAAEPADRRRSAADDDRPYDKELFERLRKARRKLAEGRGLPAYCILHDSALRAMARDYPDNERELAGISGVGESKLRSFGATFLAEIAAHLDSHPRQVFADDAASASAPNPGRAATADRRG